VLDDDKLMRWIFVIVWLLIVIGIFAFYATA
jgi:hypothetical protein